MFKQYKQKDLIKRAYSGKLYPKQRLSFDTYCTLDINKEKYYIYIYNLEIGKRVCIYRSYTRYLCCRFTTYLNIEPGDYYLTLPEVEEMLDVDLSKIIEFECKRRTIHQEIDITPLYYKQILKTSRFTDKIVMHKSKARQDLREIKKHYTGRLTEKEDSLLHNKKDSYREHIDFWYY